MSPNAVARKVYILVVVLILRSVYLVDVILYLLKTTRSESLNKSNFEWEFVWG